MIGIRSEGGVRLIALYILLGIIAFIILVFCIKITCELIYEDTFSCTVKVLCFTFSIYPENDLKRIFKKKEKAETVPEEKPPEEEKPTEDKSTAPKENFVQRFYRVQGFGGTVTFIKDILNAINGFFGDVFKRAIVIEKLFLQLYVAGNDAADTAIKYGKTCAAVFPALGYICETMKVRRYDADISVDYLAKKSTAMLNLTVSTRTIRITNAVIRLGVKALVSYLRARKRGKRRMEQIGKEAAARAAETGETGTTATGTSGTAGKTAEKIEAATNDFT